MLTSGVWPGHPHLQTSRRVPGVTAVLPWMHFLRLEQRWHLDFTVPTKASRTSRLQQCVPSASMRVSCSHTTGQHLVQARNSREGLC